MANYFGLIDNIVVLIIVINAVICNLVEGVASCNITSDFDMNKMHGNWEFGAGIYPQKYNIICARLTLHRPSEHRLKGFATGIMNGNWRRFEVQAYVRNSMFALQYMENGKLNEDNIFWINTCNGESELSLELPKKKLYLIFSKNDTISPSYLHHYETLGTTINSTLKLANDVRCNDPPQKEMKNH